MARATQYVLVSMTLLEAKSYHMAASNNIDSVSFDEIVDATGGKKDAQAACRAHTKLRQAIGKVERAHEAKATA